MTSRGEPSGDERSPGEGETALDSYRPEDPARLSESPAEMSELRCRSAELLVSGGCARSDSRLLSEPTGLRRRVPPSTSSPTHWVSHTPLRAPASGFFSCQTFPASHSPESNPTLWASSAPRSPRSLCCASPFSGCPLSDIPSRVCFQICSHSPGDSFVSPPRGRPPFLSSRTGQPLALLLSPAHREKTVQLSTGPGFRVCRPSSLGCSLEGRNHFVLTVGSL